MSIVASTLLAAQLHCMAAELREEGSPRHGRGLLEEDLLPGALLEHHAFHSPNTSRRSFFGGLVLAYVTPHREGYRRATLFRCRLHWVSPAWYQLRGDASAQAAAQLAGRQDVDSDWLGAMRAACPEALAAPSSLAELLLQEAEAHGYQGYVLEAWTLWASAGITSHPHLRNLALGLVKALAGKLHASGRLLVLPVSPLAPVPGRPPLLSAADVEALLPLVDGLSVMTYDYTAPQQSPGPSAPLRWVERNAEAFAHAASKVPGSPLDRVLLGAPLYGSDWRLHGKRVVGHEHVVGRALLQILEQHAPPGASQPQQQEEPQQCAAAEAGSACAAPADGGGGAEGPAPPARQAKRSRLRIDWNEEAAEHVFTFTAAEAAAGEGCATGGKAKQRRLALAQEFGFGVAMWEAGQALDCIFELL
eukprot:scaffold2.g6973.t1